MIRRKIICAFLALLSLGCIALPVFAVESKTLPDIHVEDIALSEEEKEKYLTNFNLIVADYDPEQYSGILAWKIDVSQNEKIAMVFDNNSVVIADKDFRSPIILYFAAADPPYRVNWNDDVLEIISNRGAIAYHISSAGELIDVSKKVQENELAAVSRRKSDTVNGEVYQLKKSSKAMAFVGGYDLLVRTDTQGNEHILYQATEYVPTNEIIDLFLPIVGNIAFVVFIVVSTIYINRKRRKTEDNSPT